MRIKYQDRLILIIEDKVHVLYKRTVLFRATFDLGDLVPESDTFFERCLNEWQQQYYNWIHK